MSNYQLTRTDVVIRAADGASIPNDPDNRDRQVFDEWVAGGGVPDPYVAPIDIPGSASKLGLKRALEELGQWDAVKAALAANAAAQEEWDLAVEVRRTDPVTQGMIAALSLSDEQVDALLVRAVELVS